MIILLTVALLSLLATVSIVAAVRAGCNEERTRDRYLDLAIDAARLGGEYRAVVRQADEQAARIAELEALLAQRDRRINDLLDMANLATARMAEQDKTIKLHQRANVPWAPSGNGSLIQPN